MRDSILNHEYYWHVKAADSILGDGVTKYPMVHMDTSMLPKKGAFYSVLTDDVRTYYKRISDMVTEKHHNIQPLPKRHR